MGSGGHNVKPVAIHVAEGTFRKDRHGDPAAAPVGTPDPPDWLSEDELEWWAATVELLSATPGLLATVDANSIARYCADQVEWLACREALANEGYVAYGEKGSPYAHPMVGIKNSCDARLAKFEAKFGLTPGDRTRLRLQVQKKAEVRRRQA